MDLELPPDALEVGKVCLAAFSAAGGVELSREAGRDPRLRRDVIEPMLERLGIRDISAATDDVTELLAAAEVCRVAGQCALPYPLASVLLSDGEGRPVAAVDSSAPHVNHGDLARDWLLVSVDAPAAYGQPAAESFGSRLGAFVTPMAIGEPVPYFDADRFIARAIALSCVEALGVAQQALALTVAHVQARQQFGRALADFQAVQFRLAHTSTSLAGLRELAYYTVVGLPRNNGSAIVDALGFRVQTITVLRDAMRTAHQLHGALGFCTEHDLTMLTRHLQPLLRLPHELSRTTEILLSSVECHGFDSTFPVPALATVSES